MNRNDLTKKLNKMLVGKSAYNIWKLNEFIGDNLKELEINDKQGEYAITYSGYTITINYKRKELVSFTIKRKQDSKFGWVVKEVVVDDDFIDYYHAHKKIKERFLSDLNKFDDNYATLYGSTMKELVAMLKQIKTLRVNKNKEQIREAIYDLYSNYWLVDEALESEGKQDE